MSVIWVKDTNLDNNGQCIVLVYCPTCGRDEWAEFSAQYRTNDHAICLECETEQEISRRNP